MSVEMGFALVGAYIIYERNQKQSGKGKKKKVPQESIWTSLELQDAILAPILFMIMAAGSLAYYTKMRQGEFRACGSDVCVVVC
jgi:hypothetical protein